MALKRPRVVVMGMMTSMPVAGVVWQYVHYLEGFNRLGYETWYVEDQITWPAVGWDDSESDPAPRAASWLNTTLEEFGLKDRWIYRARHSDDAVYGGTEKQLHALLASASLVVNLHAATPLRPEHLESERLILIDTDPTQMQIELADGVGALVDGLGAHQALFSFGENLGTSSCTLPHDPAFEFHPTRQPVVLDFWPPEASHRPVFTTIASWRQTARPVEWNGETFVWSKDKAFREYLGLPRISGASFELALDRYSHDEHDRQDLEQAGWQVSDGYELSRDPQTYRRFISTSAGEFTVAKQQYVHFGTGWFSDRSATYLAAGRPVITQDTGFGRVLPTGTGLFAFNSMDDAAAAVEEVTANSAKHEQAAHMIAREYFSHEVVLGDMLSMLGMAVPGRSSAPARDHAARAIGPSTPDGENRG